MEHVIGDLNLRSNRLSVSKSIACCASATSCTAAHAPSPSSLPSPTSRRRLPLLLLPFQSHLVSTASVLAAAAAAVVATVVDPQGLKSKLNQVPRWPYSSRHRGLAAYARTPHLSSLARNTTQESPPPHLRPRHRHFAPVAALSPSPPRRRRHLAAARHPPGARMFSPPPGPSRTPPLPLPQPACPPRATHPAYGAHSTSPRRIGCYQRATYMRWAADELLCDNRYSRRVHRSPGLTEPPYCRTLHPPQQHRHPAFRRPTYEHTANSQVGTVRRDAVS